MTLAEFKKNGFIVGREFEVEGKKFWVEKSSGKGCGRYFNFAACGRMITRATKDTVINMIVEDVTKSMKEGGRHGDNEGTKGGKRKV